MATARSFSYSCPTSAPPRYADNPALIVIGLVFGVVLLFVAAAGAIAAVLVSLARRRRQA